MDGMDQEPRTPIINIAPVSRTGMRLMFSLFGLSETGKTLSALKLAAGMEPDPSKRMLLDTEGGQRGRAYVDQIEGGYLYGQLTPPFTPERYIQAFDAIEAAGVTVCATDSISHAWFAEGGVLDMVEGATEKNDLAKWAKPKRRLGKMTRRILSSDMHMILCARAKQPLIEGQDANGRKAYVPGPITPIQEKSLRFDMTVIAHMLGDGRFSVDRADGGKCPGVLRPIFAAAELMNEDMGRALAAWVQAEGGKSPEQRRLERDAMDAAEGGVAALQAFWKLLTRDQRALVDAVAGAVANLKSIAKAADDEAERIRAEQKQRQAGATSDLDDPFGDDEEPSRPAGDAITIERVGATGPTASTPAATTSADPFWAQPSYEIIPEPRGKGGKNWPAWVEAFGHRWDSAPSEDARLKLREDNAKWFDHAAIGIPARWPEVKRRLDGKLAA